MGQIFVPGLGSEHLRRHIWASFLDWACKVVLDSNVSECICATQSSPRKKSPSKLKKGPSSGRSCGSERILLVRGGMKPLQANQPSSIKRRCSLEEKGAPFKPVATMHSPPPRCSLLGMGASLPQKPAGQEGGSYIGKKRMSKAKRQV